MPLEKLVKDLTHPLGHYKTIGEDEPVQHALKLMAQARKDGELPFLIVIGDGNEEQEVVRGFVSPPEIVFGIGDHFFKGAERIGPIFWEGQLRAECIESFHKRIGDITTPFNTCINETERIMEAIFLLHEHQVNFLPVVREKEVVGMVHLDDILTEIIGIALE